MESQPKITLTSDENGKSPSIENFRPQQFQLIEELIPSLLSNLTKIERQIHSESHLNPHLSRYDSLVKIWTDFRKQMFPIESEISVFCAEEWEAENKVDDGLVCSHIISAMITAFQEPQFKQMDQHDQSIILLSLLFHDIAKKGPPEIETKDPFHPFTSASKTLRILSRLGWISHPECVEETIEFINSSSFYYKWALFMNNDRLPEIYRRLLYVTGLLNDCNCEFTSYADVCRGVEKERLYCFEIISLVLLHQSVDFDPSYPMFTPLNRDEMRRFLTPRLLVLLSLVHKGDSGSYFLPKKKAKWTFLPRNEVETNKYLKNLY
jgi:hypothetical protein